MGEMADDLYDRMMDDMERWDDHYEDRFVYRDPWSAVCKRCGKGQLKWRTDSAGRWQLYENERIEHNRLKPHVCPQDQPNPEGFDDVD